MKNTKKTTRWTRFCEVAAKSWYRYSRNKLSVIGLIAVVLIILSAIFAPYITPFPEHASAYTDFANANQAPNTTYIFGTDQVGRDVFSRIIFAFRGALLLGLGVLVISAPFGTLMGLIAGYFNGTVVETIIMRAVDIFLALPPLVLALAVSAIMEPTLFHSMLAICFGWWAWYARISYGLASTLRNEYYVQSAELLGANTFHILVKEILPNCLGSVLTKMTLDMGGVILIGATLSYVGMGEQPPTPSLGTMISNGSAYLPNVWWLCVFPGLAIVVIVLAFNLLGDGINDMLSTKEA